MARIWSMMDIGKRSMMNSQTGLQTVGHNIANKSTEGFSRQRVDIQAAEPTGQGNLRIGTGAMAGRVKRVNNAYIEKQIEREGNELGMHQQRYEILSRVEQVFNEQVNKGLNQYMGEFFNSLREFSNNPESLASRTLVKETADHLTKDFSRIKHHLRDIQGDADFRVATIVDEVNNLTKEIAQLNEKVQMVEMGGIEANDERDRRDLLLKQLSEKVNIRYAEGEDGGVTVTAGSNAILVSGFESRELLVAATPEREGKREGNFDILVRPTPGSNPVPVTNQFTGGQLGGLLNVRDKVINELNDHVDDMAYSLAIEMNRAHSLGFDRYNKQAGRFFELPNQVRGAADTIRVAEAIMTDVGRIAAAAAPNSPADNRVANVMSNVQYQKFMTEGTATIDDFYSTVVGRVGIETSRANSHANSQKDIVNQLHHIRESISGVSLDEEATKMIEWQKAFDASARLIRTADEMLDTVLNLKRY